MKDSYVVPKITSIKDITVTVPGSKSITNRALLLAALSYGKCELKGVLFSDDSRAVLECLQELGFVIEIREEEKKVMIQGMGGIIPNSKATINVRSAGTAARFLTVMLAFAGGEYIINSSEQMKKRPMKPLIAVLREAGVEITCLEEEGHFPLLMKSEKIQLEEVSIDTNISSQFASALLIMGVLLQQGLKIHMTGNRTFGAYIKITLHMMRQFGISVRQEGADCFVPHTEKFTLVEYQIEPDLSGACYFYSMALLLKTSVIVRNVHKDSIQGDIKFLYVLEQLGCLLDDTPEGICISGRQIKDYQGIAVDMKDFSDQTMTMAVIAPFATSKTLIKNVGHIKFQESDRIGGIRTELNRIGILCEEVEAVEGIQIYPGEITGGIIETYEDHRMAMAFTLIGLKTGNISIANPGCCAKTFEHYFDIIDEIVHDNMSINNSSINSVI